MNSFGNAEGIRGATEFLFRVVGDTLHGETYVWNFGDSVSAVGPSARHVYQTDGTYSVIVTATGSEGTTAESTSVHVGTLAGVWVRDAVQGVRVRLEIIQTGPVLSGLWWELFDPGSPYGRPQDSSASAVRGSIDANNAVQLYQTGECLRAITHGTVNEDLTIMGGSGQYGNPACGDTTQGSLAWRFRRPTVPGPVL